MRLPIAACLLFASMAQAADLSALRTSHQVGTVAGAMAREEEDAGED